jgi:hypothetical protein
MEDKYAVIMLLKGAMEPSYVGEHFIAQKSDLKEKFHIKDFLYNTKKKADKMYFEMIQRYGKEGLDYIKVSKMNRYNLNAESEVLVYRDF